MSTRPSRAPGQLAVLTSALGDVAEQALRASEDLLQHCPDVGDHGTQRVLDAFTEQASDALRALAESVGDCLSGPGGLGRTGVGAVGVGTSAAAREDGSDGSDAGRPG